MMLHEQWERDSLNEKWKTAHPREIIQFACDFFGDDIAVSSSFGAESACLLSLTTQVKPDIRVLFIDTGFHFKETLEFRDQLKRRLKLNIVEMGPKMGHAAFLKEFGNLYERDPDKCCEINKVEPLQRTLEETGLRCWMTGVRGDQTAYRKGMKFVEEKKPELYKISPLLAWSSKDIYQYLKYEDLPLHPLWEKGYGSIGCEPCTAVPGNPDDPRSGRWAGKNKTECGIHTFLDTKQ
jgi:phosphoadenosine phosphosulfate reductase